MKAISVWILATLVVVGVSTLVGVSVARADTTPVITDQHLSFSTTSLSDKETAVAVLNSSGKVQMRFVMPNGLPRSQQTHCLTAAADNARGHIKIGTRYVNSGILRTTGRYGKFWDRVKKGDKFCLIHRVWRKVHCGNQVWLHAPPPGKIYPANAVQLVRYFTYTVTVRLKVNLSATITAAASCAVPGASASATVTGTGSAYVFVQGRATARTMSRATSLAGGMASTRGLNLTTSEQDYLKMTANKSATLSMTASARAVCTFVPTSPVPAPPTPAPPTPAPPTPAPPAHTCTLGWIVEKDGRTVNLNINTDNNGPVSSVTWGDGSSSTNVGLQPRHTYGSDGTWNVTATMRYNDGGVASCGTQVTTRAPQIVTQPPNAPGPNPPDTTTNPASPTNPDGSTPGGGTSSCPSGWKPDPASPATGCVPA